MLKVKACAKIITKRLSGTPKLPIKVMQMLKLIWVCCMLKVKASAKTIIKRLNGTPKPPIKGMLRLSIIWV